MEIDTYAPVLPDKGVPLSVRQRMLAAQALGHQATSVANPGGKKGLALGMAQLASAALSGAVERQTAAQEEDAQKQHRALLASALMGGTALSGGTPMAQSSAPGAPKPSAATDAPSPGPAAGGHMSYFDRLAQVESQGDDNAFNKASHATGRFQFLPSTWQGLMRQYPSLGLTSEGIRDPAQQQKAITAFTNDNVSALGRGGFEATPGNMYLAHFAGAGGALAALKANPNAPVEQVLGHAAVAANPFLRGKTAGDLLGWANTKMAGVDGTNAPVQVASADPNFAPSSNPLTVHPDPAAQDAPVQAPPAVPSPPIVPGATAPLPSDMAPGLAPGSNDTNITDTPVNPMPAPDTQSLRDTIAAAMAMPQGPSDAAGGLVPPVSLNAPASAPAAALMFSPDSIGDSSPGVDAGGMNAIMASPSEMPGAAPLQLPDTPATPAPSATPDPRLGALDTEAPTEDKLIRNTEIKKAANDGFNLVADSAQRRADGMQAAAGAGLPSFMGTGDHNGLPFGTTPIGADQLAGADVPLPPVRPNQALIDALSNPPQQPPAPAPDVTSGPAMAFAAPAADAPAAQAIQNAAPGLPGDLTNYQPSAAPMGVPGHAPGADPMSAQNFLAAPSRASMLASALSMGSGPSPVVPPQAGGGSPSLLAGLLGGNTPAAAPSAPPANQREAMAALLRDPRTTPEEFKLILDRMEPKPRALQSVSGPDGQLYAFDPGSGSYTKGPEGTKPEKPTQLQHIEGKDGKIYSFDPVAGTVKPIADASAPKDDGAMFDGKSVEGQGLNHLVKTGQLTPDQAAQFAAGKTVTDPSTGAVTFMTPQGVFRTVQPQAPAAPAAPQPGMIPLTPPKPQKFSEQESNAAGYTGRMQDAEKVLEQPGIAGAVQSRYERGKAAIPFVGNSLVSSDYQQGEQAQRNFVNAQLRRESGAAISQGEFDNANKQYFPQPGDSEAVLAQKAQNRQAAIAAMQKAAGGAYQPPAPAQAGPAPAPAMAAPPPAAVQYLRQNPGLAAQFDAKYGPGTAAKVLGQ